VTGTFVYHGGTITTIDSGAGCTNHRRVRNLRRDPHALPDLDLRRLHHLQVEGHRRSQFHLLRDIPT
jgi:hypothetical protein